MFTKQLCKNNPEISFTKADKGNVTFCSSRNECISRTELLFSDKNTYKVLNRYPLKKWQPSVYNILKEFNEKGYLGNGRYSKKSLSQTHTLLARAYALPKVHKLDTPFHPIVSTVNSTLNFLSKILDQKLKDCIKNPNSQGINNFDSIEKSKPVAVPQDYCLISFDVSSLFTNVPESLVIESFDKRFFQIHTQYKIPFSTIIDKVEFLFDNNFFQFNGKYYQQIFGSWMSSPTSPQFANSVLEDLEFACLLMLKDNYDCNPFVLL